MGGATKMYEFSDKFQTAFDPPSFSVNHVALFLNIILKKPGLKVKICNINFWIENNPSFFSENSSVLVEPPVP